MRRIAGDEYGRQQQLKRRTCRVMSAAVAGRRPLMAGPARNDSSSHGALALPTASSAPRAFPLTHAMTNPKATATGKTTAPPGLE
jgi:hypothetical protein